MRGTLITVVLGCITLAWSGDAAACKCGTVDADLATELQNARTGASAIYFARVDSTDGKRAAGRARVRVVERFKGEFRVGQELVVPSGGGGDCTYPFETGKTYLIYAGREGPSDVYLCSRTHPVSADDPEVTWLRTGVLPPLPVALQREFVTCRSCSLSVTTTELVGSRVGQDCDAGPEVDQAVKAAARQQPFASLGFDGTVGRGDWSAIGLSATGRGFKLVETADASGDWCRRRIVRHWCSGLKRAEPHPQGTAFECLEPAAPEVVCDESASRKSRWGPLEALSTASCTWFSAAKATCTLISEVVETGPARVGKPLLRCSPASPESRMYFCRVSTP